MTPVPGDLSAVIPAAGLSSRMHQYKPLLNLGDCTMLEQVVGLFRESGIQDIIVVTGHNQEKIKPLIRKAGARPVFNPDFRKGMLGSIQTGVRAVSGQSRGFFLLPVDIPAIRPATIQALMCAFARVPDKILIPEFDSIPGHPPLIPAWVIPEILSLPPESNLGNLLFSLAGHREPVQVTDRGILMDADTPDAFDRVRKRFQRLTVPDREECMFLIRSEFGADPGTENQKIIDHLVLVADTAVKLTMAVMEASAPPSLDLNLIRAGALLHDIKRKEPNHARAGKELLLFAGFPQTAEIAGQHMDLNSPVPDFLTEVQMVYFADKICGPDGLDLDIDSRFRRKMEEFPQAEAEIFNRYEHTRHIQARIETVCGRPVRHLLGQA